MEKLLSDPRLCGWDPEQITTIADPLSVPDLAGQISDLAEACTGVFLLYYVGHGVLSSRGELCLTVTTTRPNRPKITGIPWDVLAEAFRTSPGTIRIAILDCCFAGQAIEALTSADGLALSDLTHVQGVYTLTATTRNNTAHVPALDLQETSCTSFTGALHDLVRNGISGGPRLLTFADIYPKLRAQLQIKGLPQPNQRGTDTAIRFPFAVNHAVGAGDRTGPPVAVPWSDLLGIADIAAFEPAAAWRRHEGRDRLRIPFGVSADGRSVELDLKEAAENGAGPHGLCIGTTGSGKSEFLRTLILGLLATHSPEQLNLVLIDFKGGATFLEFEGAQHIAAVITNLEVEAVLVDRMRDALAGELQRRQELLRAAGPVANISQYEKMRAAGASFIPLPALFVVVDEFSELLNQQPHLIGLFESISRLGRSLGIHLLLSAHRLEENTLRDIIGNLSYRICLKPFSTNEFREVLGLTETYDLPIRPGEGYLRSGSGEVVRFQASYVSGPSGQSDSGDPPDFSVSTLQQMIAQIRGHGRPAHEIWLPPLAEAPTLDQLIPRVPGGFQPAAGALTAPIGVVDLPYYQRRGALWVDLSGPGGNVAIAGGPQSGKSTALCTLIMAMSLVNTSEQVQFYCLDFGGGALNALANLPHVGSVCGRQSIDTARRTVAKLTDLIRKREIHFAEFGIESIAEFRRLRQQNPDGAAATAAHADPFGDAFLVVDGFGVIGSDFDDFLRSSIVDLAARGLSYGVHVIVTFSRWSNIPVALADQISTRLELRLGDPMESVFDREVAARVPQESPGRGMTPAGQHMLIGLPRIDGKSDSDGMHRAIADAVAFVVQTNSGREAPPVRVLPTRLQRSQLLSMANDWPSLVDRTYSNLRIPVGITESELEPIYLDFAKSPHLMIVGDAESGKTTLLRNIINSVAAANTTDNVRFIVADCRHSLLGEVPQGFLAGYGSTMSQIKQNMVDLAEYIGKRSPPHDVSPQQLRTRSWRTGPELFVIVDDHDLVAAASNPLEPLLDYLPLAPALGFHLIVARRTTGAAMAMTSDSILLRLRALGTSALVLSCSRHEPIPLGDFEPRYLRPGQGHFVTRNDEQFVQLAE
ncbi:type VII secretion protein EccCb [Nocardia sp. NPDC050712]|uniref:type VII secretion protein EccCb n=1 Tax=Nocardia sp. NPDC050712 TaxID=3155518 RepID=UPI0033E74E08